MIEKITNRIKYKLQNNNLDFTADEILIIQENPSLIEDIIRMLASDISYWTEKNINKLDVIISSANDIFLANLPEEIIDAYFINLVEYYSRCENFRYMSSKELAKQFPISQKALKQIELILERIYQDERRVLNRTALNAGEIINLLDLKQYYELSYCYKVSRYTEVKIIQRFIEEFPFEKYDTPLFIADCEPQILTPVLDKLSLNVLNVLTIKNENNEEVLNAFINKIKKTRYSDATYVGLLKSSSLNEETFDSIALQSFNNNIIDFVEHIINRKLLPKDEIITKIINYINTTNNLNMNVIYPLLENERIIESLIKNGWINELIDYRNLKTYEVNEIVDNINGLNPKYKRFAERFILNNKIQEYPTILEALSNHPKLKITISNETILKPSGEKILIKYIKQNNIDLSKLSRQNLNGLIRELLKCNKDSELYDIIRLYFKPEDRQELIKIIFDDNKDIIIDLIENNIAIPKDLVEEFSEEFVRRPKILKATLLNDYILDKLLDKIYHNENLDYFYTQENVLLLKEYLANKYNVDIERILIISKKIGPQIIKYIANENIQKILRLEDNDFYKILNLFEKEEYTLRDLESAYDSLKQLEFSRKYQDIINIFNNTLIAIENNNEVDLKDIHKYLDEKFFESIKETYELPEEYSELHPRDFLLFVIEKIKQNPKRDKYKELFHKVTDYYISKKREKYRNTYEMEKELELNYTPVEKSVHDELIKYYLTSCNKIEIDYYGEICTLSTIITRKLQSTGMDSALITDCINYVTGRTETFTNEIDLIKKQIYKLVKITKEINNKIKIMDDVKLNYIKQNLIRSGRIKRTYYLTPKSIDIYDLLGTLNINIIKDTINNNEAVYRSLKNILKRHKLLYLPDELKNLLRKEYVQISDDYTNIIGFITYYKSILEHKIGDKKLTLSEILIQAEVYGGVSNIYSQVLGIDDYKFIKTNPGPNSAVRTSGRLEKAVNYTIKNYQRTQVTTPTFNEIININNKPIRVILGNFTCPETLTYGERTGSCMRIGGAGETLFEFILENKNGFHIKFEDPFTGEFISRVSGFRNGNSVFLNQLRNSTNKEKYTDEEIIEYCKRAADRIIELSENSSVPIQNIFVDKSYAMNESSNEKVSWNVDIKKGLPYFYSDISTSGIILSTKAKGNKYVTIKTGMELPTYLPARENVIESTNIKDVMEKIVRVSTIKSIISGEQMQYIDEITINEIKYAVVNNDWYIYVDNEGNIHKEIIDIDPRAIEEFNEYLRKVEKTYGGTSWHIA